MDIEVKIPDEKPRKRKVTVSLPAYYRHDLDSDDEECCIYGMVDETLTKYSINVSRRYDTEALEIEVSIKRYDKVDDFQAEYHFGIDPEHRSSKEEFDAAWAKAREALRPLLEGGT